MCSIKRSGKKVCSHYLIDSTLIFSENFQLHLIYDSEKLYEWSRESCILSFKNPTSAVCKCFGTGSFSITNDLYDPSVSFSQHSSTLILKKNIFIFKNSFVT